MVGESILLAMIAGIIIVWIGYSKNWDSSLPYCNAFFIAGCLLIMAGASSKLAAGQEWNRFQYIHAESLRHMSSGDRANFMIKTSSSSRLVILGLLSGGLLILVSVLLM